MPASKMSAVKLKLFNSNSSTAPYALHQTHSTDSSGAALHTAATHPLVWSTASVASRTSEHSCSGSASASLITT
jgi:hypothetical protein